MVDLNSAFTSQTESGVLRFSGLASGIDSQSTIDAIIQARRAPIVNIEDKIEANNNRVAAYEEFKSLATDFKSALNLLRGDNSFSNTDVFKQKLAFSTAAATDTAPADHTPSEASSILGVSTTNKVTEASHTVVVKQLAKANQIRTDAFNSKTTDLTTLGVTAGTFTLNGETITVNAGDTLVDLRDKINSSESGVNATVISSDSTTHYLVLSADDTGTANAIDLAGGTVTSDDLGLTDGLGSVKNELVAARDAILDVNGLTDITRSSNTIDDIIEGVTLDLFKAETDTEITVDIEADLAGVKEAVNSFVESFNAIRDFIAEQRTEVDRDEDGDKEFGPLAFDATLRQISERMNLTVAKAVDGLADGYQSMGQIGVVMNSNFRLEMDNDVFDNKILTNLDGVRKVFAFDFSSSDSRVTHLSHTGQTTDGTYYLIVAGTDVDGNVTSANIQTSAGAGAGGADDGSAVATSSTVLATSDVDAQGLKLLYSGGASDGGVDDVEISYTRGVADQLYYFFNDVTKSQGTIDKTVNTLEEQTGDFEDRIANLEARLAVYEKQLQAKFVAMETAVAQLESLKSTLTQYQEQQGGE